MSKFYQLGEKISDDNVLIICCLIGGPYFGGQRVIEAMKIIWEKQGGGRPRRMDTESDETADADESGCSGNQRAAGAQKGGPFVDVDQSYLDDAVFIGDSRTDTLKMYAGWDNATYYVKTGTNIWDIMDVVPDDENITIDEELQKHQLAKSILCWGSMNWERELLKPITSSLRRS